MGHQESRHLINSLTKEDFTEQKKMSHLQSRNRQSVFRWTIELNSIPHDTGENPAKYYSALNKERQLCRIKEQGANIHWFF
jgi:hypothetical protein